MDNNFHQDLHIRPVEEKDVDQFNELLSYVFQITESDIEESGYESKREMIKSKRPILELSKVFGWFNGDQLVSQIAVYPCEVNIHGTLYKMGGVTGVGTYPEYAGHGLMKDLIKLALETMRADKQWISYLYPYNVPYYRRKGWEMMSDKLTFKIRDTQLPKTVEVPGIVERKEVDDPDVFTVYNQFSRENHGALQRTAFHWEEYWRYENEESRTAAVYYNKSGHPTGVLFYWVAEEVFHVKEMFYLNQEARNGLWNFISAHFSMVYWVKGDIYKNEPLAFLLEDSQIKETIEPYYMARIVDVTEFLKKFPFKAFNQPFHFVVSDPVAEWNNGIFGLNYAKGEVIVSNDPIGKAVQLDIQTLTCVLMNYRRPAYLARIERLHTDSDTLQLLETIIPDMEAYFGDYF
ncbi:GNAT family N-acetyltransferase [Enterococcus gallinarum]|uniref:GNAT family N-acetyltransferase n=1 Tax=Enterococcus gallinarum TaxID=1353 RepID=A0ABD4HRF5_ENTGA|nr:GNAT family N-acetyltransferase [Enterococcus gallinarum]MBA0949503.1 GNAT family N-acetyltransferase [Enterococcus gallinarum]MBA0962459.1 GNAT family N-acetyltransferase [Enterococcus gallinarum]MBA0970395.1 GNAT family N-acetyltransferase [Enterococcus gallinarum]MBA0973791.1 GNAT family N-acetyltransferase [Enterococcus gallinarum]MCR1931869.1 GNAT family N-acetyltransferase [Enterococcus gallinarum]